MRSTQMENTCMKVAKSNAANFFIELKLSFILTVFVISITSRLCHFYVRKLSLKVNRLLSMPSKLRRPFLIANKQLKTECQLSQQKQCH